MIKPTQYYFGKEIRLKEACLGRQTTWRISACRQAGAQIATRRSEVLRNSLSPCNLDKPQKIVSSYVLYSERLQTQHEITFGFE